MNISYCILDLFLSLFIIQLCYKQAENHIDKLKAASGIVRTMYSGAVVLVCAFFPYIISMVWIHAIIEFFVRKESFSLSSILTIVHLIIINLSINGISKLFKLPRLQKANIFITIFLVFIVQQYLK